MTAQRALRELQNRGVVYCVAIRFEPEGFQMWVFVAPEAWVLPLRSPH